MGPVRKSLILPLHFLFNFLIIVIVIAGLDLLYRIGAAPTEQGVAVINMIPYSVKQVLPAACICALLFTFLRMVKKPGSHLLSLLLLMTTASAVLIFSEIGVSLIEREQPARTLNASNVLKPGVFHVYGEGLLYVEEIEGDSLERVVNVRQKIQYLPRTEARLTGNTIAIDMSLHSEPALEFPAITIRERIFRPVISLGWFLRDYAILTDDLSTLLEERGWEFYLLCVSLIFFVLGTNMWMRITRWPLFNFLLVVLIIRGVFFLYAYVRLNLANELGKLFEGSILAKNLPSFGLLLLGLLFILAEALFVPYDRLSKDGGE